MSDDGATRTGYEPAPARLPFLVGRTTPSVATETPPLRRSLGTLWDLAAIVLLAFVSPVFLHEIPSGEPPYGADILVHVYPLFSLLSHGLHLGRPTLWNFYAAGGYPLAPYSALSIFPPTAVALSIFGPTAALAVLDAFYLAVLGIGMYLLAADLDQSRPARLLAAITLAGSGFIAAHLYAGHVLEIGAICPTPFALLLLRRAIMRHSTGAAAACGVVVGTMILAAGVQFLPFALAPLPLLVIWHSGVQLAPGRLAPRAPLWPLAAGVIAAVVAALLSAALWLPSIEVWASSLRAAAPTYADATRQSLPLQGLVMLVAPDGLGNAAAGTYWPADRSAPYFHEIYAYAGLLPLLLAGPALWRRAAWPYALLALAALLVMLGDAGVVDKLVYALPGAGLVRAPARAGFLLDLALALLAGFGLDALRDGTTRRRARAALLPGALAGVAGLLWLIVVALHRTTLPEVASGLANVGAQRLVLLLGAGGAVCVLAMGRAPAAGLLVVGLAALDLYGANGALLRPNDPARYFSTQTATAAQKLVGTSRILARDGSVPLGLGMASRALYDTQDAAPLALAGYWTLGHPSLLNRNGGRPLSTSRDVIHDVDPLFLRLFGVGTVLSAATDPISSPVLRAAGTASLETWTVPGGVDWNAHLYRTTSLVYRDAHVLSRTFVVTSTMPVTDAAAALAMVRAGTVGLTRTVVLTPPPSGLSTLPVISVVRDAWADWLSQDDDNTLTVKAEGGAAGGYLVIDDGWFPGWSAIVDGYTTPVRQADYLLKAVRLPPGVHTVRLVYAPLSYLAGLTLTLLTVLMLCAAAARSLPRRAARRPVRTP